MTCNRWHKVDARCMPGTGVRVHCQWQRPQCRAFPSTADPMQQDMAQTPKIRDVLAAASRSLGARNDAEYLLMHVLEVDREWLFAHALETLDPASATRYAAMVARRAEGVPVAYLTGRRGFWSLDLTVTPATLVPRPETELLVELALERLAPDTPLEVADLGTGSGAIALALAHERPHARVLATDRSVEALAVAQANARRLRIGNVRFVSGDWFAPLGRRRFDVIVSNPPYVAEGDPHLARGDPRHEPRQALVAGADGLDAVRVLAVQAGEYLADGGWLLVEHGYDQGAPVRELLHKAGFVDVFTARDLEARERVSGGCKGVK